MENLETTTQTTEELGAAQEAETKTYTQDEVLKLIQSEADKRVSQALKTQQKKYERELSLSKLDDEARARAERDDRIAELEALVSEYQIDRNRSELKSVLSARGLSAEFADIIHITDDVELNQERIDKLDKLFRAAVKGEVEKRLAATAGVPKTSVTDGMISKETAKNMTLAQKRELAQTNPETYRKIFG